MQTVSRSVERVFELLELFKAERRPLTAADVRRRLGLPHSSSVVLLAHLKSLGYVDQDARTLAYFPSRALQGLCAWIADAPGEYDPVGRLALEVHDRVGETTSISRRVGLFSLTVYSRVAEHRDAVDVRAGVTGGLLTLTVVGRALLSTVPDHEVRTIVEHANSWARMSKLGLAHDVEPILRTLAHVRAQGYLYDCNLLVPNVGAVAFPLTGPGFEVPLALTIAARTDRMERRGAKIIREAREIIARFSGASTVSVAAGRRPPQNSHATPKYGTTGSQSRRRASTASVPSSPRVQRSRLQQ